jgi:predicted permease
MLLIAACPVGANVYVFASQYQAAVETSATAILISTGLSMLSLSALAILLSAGML